MPFSNGASTPGAWYRPSRHPDRPSGGWFDRYGWSAIRARAGSSTPPSAAVFSLRLTANAIGTFVSVLGLSLGLLALAPMAFGFRSVVVASGSMAPALRVSDVVVLGDADDPLPVGAVIDFQVGGERRIHRIVQTIGSEYTTKGDANRSADGGRVAAEDINGVGVMVVPFIGVPSLWLDQGRWLNLAALFVMIAAAVRTTPRRWLFRNDVEGRRFGAGR